MSTHAIRPVKVLEWSHVAGTRTQVVGLTLPDVSGLASGTYIFYCTLHSDTSDPDPGTAGMAGTLVVR